MLPARRHPHRRPLVCIVVAICAVFSRVTTPSWACGTASSQRGDVWAKLEHEDSRCRADAAALDLGRATLFSTIDAVLASTPDATALEEPKRLRLVRATTLALSDAPRDDTHATVRLRRYEAVLAAARAVDPKSFAADERPQTFAQLSLAIAGASIELDDPDGAVRTLGPMIETCETEASQFVPPLRQMRAEALRRLGSFEAAEADLDAAEFIIEQVWAGSDAAGDPLIAEYIRSCRLALIATRCAYQRDLGLVEQAAISVGIEAGLVRTEFQDECDALLLDQASVALAGARYGRVSKLLDEDLEQTAPWLRERLFAIRGIARVELAGTDPIKIAAARSDLERVVARPPNAQTRRMAERGLVRLALLRGEFAHAKVLITRALAQLAAEHAPDHVPARLDDRAFFDACAVRIARETGADSATRDAALSNLRESFRDLIEAWNKTPLRAGGVGFLAFATRRAVLGELVAELLARTPDREVTADVLAPAFEAQAAGTLARELGAGPGTLDDAIHELVAEDGGLLLFVPAADSVHVFAIDGTEKHTHCEVPWTYMRDDSTDDLSGLVRLTLAADAAPGDVDAHVERVLAEAARVASSLLPVPIRERISRWSGFYVVGLELFDNLPFEVLPLLGSEPLGITKAVCRLPSIPVALALAARRRPAVERDDSIWFLAAPTISPDVTALFPKVSTLPMDRRIAARLIDPFGPTRVRVLVGADASIDALSEAAANPPRILHVFTHAVRQADRETYATLVMAGRAGATGFLEIDRAKSLLRSNTVILSACEASSSPTRLGDDGAGSLAAACFTAGANAVVSSADPLEYHASIAMTEALHSALARGTHVAGSLRVARATLWKHPRFKTPSCWALLVANGLGFDECLPRSR